MTFPTARIGMLFDVKNGATPKSDIASYWDGGISWLTPSDLGRLEGESIRRGSRDISLAGLNSCATQVVPKGSIILSIRAPIGHLAIADEPTAFNQGCRGLIPRAQLQEKYAFWAMAAAKPDLISNGQGTTFMELSRSALRSISVPLPAFDTQTAIARFLDRETGRIDGLIEKKTRFIALLKEKRAAVITHAVTKGINADAPMKDSGVDWLGRVPAHWDVVPPTALFTESKERAREGDQMLSATQKYGVIPLAEYEALEQRQVTMAVVNLNMRKHVEVGDFVISMRSMDGGLERARAVGSVRSSYSVLKTGPDVEGRFYGALMKSSLFIQALRLTSNFIRDGQDLNFGHVRKVKLPKPDLREQAAIADYIEAETARIDGLITLTERGIDLLREKRAALITAAVTGKIDVRTAA